MIHQSSVQKNTGNGIREGGDTMATAKSLALNAVAHSATLCAELAALTTKAQVIGWMIAHSPPISQSQIQEALAGT
jgi:hypothetical protein